MQEPSQAFVHEVLGRFQRLKAFAQDCNSSWGAGVTSSIQLLQASLQPDEVSEEPSLSNLPSEALREELASPLRDSLEDELQRIREANQRIRNHVQSSLTKLIQANDEYIDIEAASSWSRADSLRHSVAQTEQDCGEMLEQLLDLQERVLKASHKLLEGERALHQCEQDDADLHLRITTLEQFLDRPKKSKKSQPCSCAIY